MRISPVMKLALIAAPVVALYSPTVPPLEFVTKRVSPNTASPKGAFSPVMKLGLAAWAFLGMAQRPATTKRNAYKPRKSGLQFEVAVVVCMELFILGSESGLGLDTGR